NLMDYAQGTFLHKHQWDMIHDPEAMAALFQDDADGAYADGQIKFIEFAEFNFTKPEEASNAAGYLTFLTPVGSPITLPFDAKLTFTGKTNLDELDNMIPNGSLLAFKLPNGPKYRSRYGKSEGKWIFKGYVTGSEENNDLKYFNGENYQNLSSSSYKVVVAKYLLEECKVDIGIATSTEKYIELIDIEKPLSDGITIESLSPDYTKAGIVVVSSDCLDEGPGKYFYEARKDDSNVPTSLILGIANYMNTLHEMLYEEFETNAFDNMSNDDYVFYDMGGINTVEDYQKFENSLKRFINDKEQIYNEFIEIIENDNSSQNEVLAILSKLTINHAEALSAEDRIRALRKLNQGELTGNWLMGDGGEFSVIKLIATTPEDQILTLFNDLSTSNMMKDLNRKTDDYFFGPDNYTRLIQELSKLFYKFYSTNPADETMLNRVIEEEKIIRWTSIDSYLVQENDYSAYYTEHNLINIILNTIDYEIEVPENAQSGYAASVTEESSQTDYVLNPFEPIGIFFETEEAANAVGAVAGETYIFPAFYFVWLKKQDDNQKIEQGISDALTISSFFIGIGELAVAKGMAKLAVSVFQLGISSINTTLDQETRESLIQEGHEELVVAFDLLSIMLEASSLSKNQYRNAIHLTNIWNSSKESIQTVLEESKYEELESYVKAIELNESE
ncbi:MAG: hypothetical protein ACQETL_20135, partial [Bacteroidota bacterium]